MGLCLPACKGLGRSQVMGTMACTPPSSASEVFCRAGKCRRWSARFAMVGAVILAIIIAKTGAEFIRDASGSEGHAGQRIAGHLTIFAAQFTLLWALLFAARRGYSAAHHASVKANNLMALELLAAQATDDATKKEILGRAADLVAGKPGCCK